MDLFIDLFLLTSVYKPLWLVTKHVQSWDILTMILKHLMEYIFFHVKRCLSIWDRLIIFLWLKISFNKILISFLEKLKVISQGHYGMWLLVKLITWLNSYKQRYTIVLNGSVVRSRLGLYKYIWKINLSGFRSWKDQTIRVKTWRIFMRIKI